MAKVNQQLITKDDIYLFNEGNHFRLYEKFGAQVVKNGGKDGVHFSVWAPNAEYVSVIGDFNSWNEESHQLSALGTSGIWSGFFPGIAQGVCYKYHIRSKLNNYRVNKADPFAFFAELPPATGSKVWDLEYNWGDSSWMKKRKTRNALDAPMSIYEVHLGSWMRHTEDNRYYTYREMAPKLVEHMRRGGFTHLEFLPIMEHPFYGSWGYQVTGYFATTSRYGTPQDFMYLVDYLHQHDLGVILDWVPSHFPTDEHGLSFFDGTHLFEHADPRKGYHPDWGSLIFNYGRNEVQSFLVSNALFWLDKFHVDGLRVDAVASMLYLDYSRKQGEWIPNKYGGRENIEAVDFLRKFNSAVFQHHPDVQTIAEESTAWPMVSRPTYLGGLGFGLKWDMGWMHDTLQYFQKDTVHRKHHQNTITFRMIYAFNENFALSLSHDEVVHGKGSLINKMPGDDWQKFANLRALYGYMFAQPGKKLLFMGQEFGQFKEWNHEEELSWQLLQQPLNRGLLDWMNSLNHIYREEEALYELDCNPEGFEWVDTTDSEQSVIAFLRKAKTSKDPILVVCNFTPVPRHNYRIGVPYAGRWKEILNSDAKEYGGSGVGNLGGVDAKLESAHGRPFSVELTLPPLSVIYLKGKAKSEIKNK